MKRTGYLRKKSLVKTPYDKAFRSCERALIAAVNRRDKVCQLCRSPYALQMDHAIVSRKHLSTFFEIRQMVLLCEACHKHKTDKVLGVDGRVTEVVRRREGAPFISEVQARARQIKKWTITELEYITKYFKGFAA